MDYSSHFIYSDENRLSNMLMSYCYTFAKERVMQKDISLWDYDEQARSIIVYYIAEFIKDDDLPQIDYILNTVILAYLSTDMLLTFLSVCQKVKHRLQNYNKFLLLTTLEIKYREPKRWEILTKDF